ncbi:MAG: pilus assembly protein [Rhizobiales bacterium]|nr:pilus assembly protein [Hyphomicrobiales bacterium]OJY41640.1 MAG: pilus assembly protein TadE [Rhizobiales bacterium 64-17]
MGIESTIATLLASIRLCRRGTSAIEFALVVPVFVMLLFGMITYGSYLAVVHGVQQLVAEAARAAVAGMTDDERNTLARSYIDGNIGAYPLLSARHLTLDSSRTDPASGVFSVTVHYDLSDMPLFAMPSIVPSPPTSVVRSAAIQRGGY